MLTTDVQLTFTEQVLIGLWRIRNRESDSPEIRELTRRWLRQHVRYMREKRSR